MKQFLITIMLAVAAVGCLAVGAHAQAKPDLVVTRAIIGKDPSGLFVDKITVSVENTCTSARSGTSYVLVTFKASDAPGAKAIYYVGNTVKALAGGEVHSQTFNVGEKKIGVGRHVIVEADPYKKVAEASEDNNVKTLFPDSSPAGLTGAKCGGPSRSATTTPNKP